MNKKTDKSSPQRPRKLRCAIYTRKSSEEGLEQDFNSLDAQREACEAFVASQKHEGWTVVPELYDDGGFSGGTMERPAFRRLLSDVRAGKIDVVVVYKVDHLTRSLSDFAKIVEIFDKRSVSFVSVTQQFNTTSSMGRLTLNILLSFAQFEREVTSERIRDKIAASKKKGIWMGGMTPLGYDVKDRKLVVNEAEATTVRNIFRRYIELKSVRLLKADLDARGIVSKVRKTSNPDRSGGRRIARGALYLMLQNRIYRGEITHKGNSYPGEHQAIIDEPLWNQAQAILTDNHIERSLGVSDKCPSLLAGFVYDARGERLTPTHANKKGVRYRYYVSRSLIVGTAKETGQRIPATSLEGLVTRRIGDWLADPAALLGVIQERHSDATVQDRLMKQAARYVAAWDELKSTDLRRFLITILDRIQVHTDRIEISIKPSGLVQWFNEPNDQAELDTPAPPEPDNSVITLTVPARLKRAGMEMRIVAQDGSEPACPDLGLVRLLVRANAIRDRMFADKSLTLDEIAKQEGIVPSYVTRLFRLTLLAPDIIGAIIAGTHPPELTARRLLDDTRFPLDWREQRRLLGFA